MASVPANPRAVVFFDGQNLYHAAKVCFGYRQPNYDPLALANLVCTRFNWNLAETRFYTGIPDAQDDPVWHRFWSAKPAAMGRRGVRVFSRALRYRNHSVRLPDGSEHVFLKGEEKGVDVRIAVDVISLAWRNLLDVAVIFSQDQDLSEVAAEIRHIAAQQDRWIKVASAFPTSPVKRYRRGIDRTDWIPIERTDYDTCLDPRDYRPRTASALGG
jgi:uncharacterized LabA/DUF88 family protein